MTPRKPRAIDTLRTPPHSIDAEQSVLGGLMLNEQALAKVSDWLNEEHFYRKDHRLIYRAICELAAANKPYDAVTMGEWVEQNNVADLLDVSYVIRITNATPSAANIVAYASIVLERARLRQLIDVGTKITSDAWSPGAEVASIATAAASAINGMATDPRSGGLAPVRSAVVSWIQVIQQRHDRGEHLTGLETPYAKVNEMTQGLQPGDTIIIAGRPSMGKTILWENIARHCAVERGEPVALFSLEMRKEAIVQRGVSALSGVPHEHLRRAWQLDDDEWAQITAATVSLNKAPYWIDDQPGLTAAEIVARAKRMHQQRPLKLVGIDHIGRMRLPGRANKAEEIGDALKLLQGEAKRLGWVLVIVSQLNRNLYGRTDLRPNMGDLKASGAIEEDADVIFFVHREDYYDTPDKRTHLQGVVELIPAKGRDFANNHTIYLRNGFDRMRAEDWHGPLPKPPEPEKRVPRETKGFKASGNGKAAPELFGERDS